MKKKVKVGENIGKPWVRVSLQRMDAVNPFRSWCPICNQGVLLVQAVGTGTHLLRADHCSMCGQRFIYEDNEIEGKPLNPPLAELLTRLAGQEVTTRLRTRFERIDDI